MDLKAEIEKRVLLLKQKAHSYHVLIVDLDEMSKIEVLTAVYCQIVDELIFLDLLKHEAFQTTEPCMTKEGLVGKGGHTHGEG